MKRLMYFTIAAFLFISCNSPRPAASDSETDAIPTYSLNEVWSTDTIMRTSESVLFDEDRQVLFVACINGAPSEKNGTGYIARLNPDGTVETAEWVTGLNAPKGMGQHGNMLYVTDIDQVVIIDIEKSEISERISIPGASFLNDIAIDSDGTVYFSDSDTGWLWKLAKGEATPWIMEGLDRPNGLFVEETRVLLASSESSDLKIIDKAAGTFETVTTEIGRGDGIEFTGEKGHYIVSSWSGEVFLVFPDFSKVSLLKTSDQKINTADIGFNVKEQVVYIPTFFDNRVVAYKLVKSD